MKEVLATNSPTIPFDAIVLYPNSQHLDQLELPFQVEEVERVVSQLANNKSSGPDGLPNEFIKLHWNELKEEIMGILDCFHRHDLDLRLYNEANIVMVPKNDAPATMAEFRPISVINLIHKLISKVLSNRLRPFLPSLISPNQTVFIQGRQISDNFVATRELLHHVSNSNRRAIFAKVDFRKAFDTVQWNFLHRVMAARGFPN